MAKELSLRRAHIRLTACSVLLLSAWPPQYGKREERETFDRRYDLYLAEAEPCRKRLSSIMKMDLPARPSQSIYGSSLSSLMHFSSRRMTDPIITFALVLEGGTCEIIPRTIGGP